MSLIGVIFTEGQFPFQEKEFSPLLVIDEYGLPKAIVPKTICGGSGNSTSSA
jgi:hypothetical protein